jgi:hypothetical protein
MQVRAQSPCYLLCLPYLSALFCIKNNNTSPCAVRGGIRMGGPPVAWLKSNLDHAGFPNLDGLVEYISSTC